MILSGWFHAVDGSYWKLADDEAFLYFDTRHHVVQVLSKFDMGLSGDMILPSNMVIAY